ncbi:MAG: fumarylacetoacetate hydrolase family protein [Steroidobacteraceae bacterium]
MQEYVFPPLEVPSIDVAGQRARFPVHRIYCVGRNYREHAIEMGGDPTRELPFFFQKAPDSIIPTGAAIPYPARTRNFHHEIELVVAIGKPARNLTIAQSLQHVFGYAVGNDFTRRDLQNEAKEKRRPWDTAKNFDASAAIGQIHAAQSVGHLASGRIWLAVNGNIRQDADIADLIWNVPEIVAELSTYFELLPGDLIFTGTPAGVGSLAIGDVVTGGIDGLGELTNRICQAPGALE